MSLLFNKRSIIVSESILKNDGVLTVDVAAITLRLPLFDDIDIKDGKYFYIIANESYDIETVDGLTVLNINGATTYTVPQFQHAKITLIANEWYFTIYDITASGGGGITDLTGDVTGTGPGSTVATIANDAVTYAKMQNVSTNNRLLGRATAGAGNVEEITLGTGLSLTGTTLNVTVTTTVPGGSNGQFQYNNGGAFGGAAELTYSAGVVTAMDSRFRISDNTDPTKLIAFEAASITTATTRTYTGPDASGVLVLDTNSQTVSNKVFDNSNRYTAWDSRFTLQDNADNTKQAIFEASGISTATTRTFTFPNVSGTLITTADTGTVSTTMIANDAVTLAKLVNATTNNRLLGRATAGAGDWEEITLGTNLSFTGTTLNAAGGGGSPGGSTTQVQFNNAGAFDGDANMVWDDTNSQLTLLGAGTNALPTLAIGAVDTGIYLPLASQLGFTCGGALQFRLDSTSFRSNTTGGGIVRSAAGAASTPTFSFQGDTNTGIYNNAADTMAFVAGGNTRFQINDNDGFFGSGSFAAYIKSGVGTSSLPTYSFTTDTDTGFWSNAANTIKWSTAGGQRGSIDSVGRMFVGTTTAPTAWVHVAATTTTAGTGGIKFTSGALMTTAEAGAVEFVTDDLYFTITTGAARKNITLWDTLGTSGRVPFATTNGRLTDDADFTFATDTLTVTKIAATEYTGTQTYADTINLIFNTGTGSKIGTAVTQKIGFWNVTPVVQPAGANQAAITDSTTGTAGFTLVDVGAVPTQAAINDNFASLNRQVDAFRTALIASGMIKGAA